MIWLNGDVFDWINNEKDFEKIKLWFESNKMKSLSIVLCAIQAVSCKTKSFFSTPFGRKIAVNTVWKENCWFESKIRALFSLSNSLFWRCRYGIHTQNNHRNESHLYNLLKNPLAYRFVGLILHKVVYALNWWNNLHIIICFWYILSSWIHSDADCNRFGSINMTLNTLLIFCTNFKFTPNYYN